MKNKILLNFNLVILIFTGMFSLALPAIAADPIQIPPSTASQGPCASIINKGGNKVTVVENGAEREVPKEEALGYCVVKVYQWSLGVAVILALLMIILAGYLYMTALGNAQRVETAKEMFAGALTGLVILFAAVVILRTINPELINFKPPTTQP